MFTLDNVLDGKKTENLIGRGREGGCWNKNVLGGKILKNEWGGGGTAINNLRVSFQKILSVPEEVSRF